jgi:hypothetical protein
MDIDGRYPRRATTFDGTELQQSLKFRGGKYYIRLDDPEAPDFWLEIVISSKELADAVRFEEPLDFVPKKS